MKKIVKGIVNHILDNELELSKTRMDICNKCEEKYSSKLGDRCGLCGCILSFKTKSPDTTCPINKW